MVSSITAGLRERGHDVVVISAVDDATEGIFGAMVVEDRPRVRPNLLAAIHNVRPDIIHVHCYSSWLPANVCALRLGTAPIVFTPHYHPWGSHARWKRALFDAGVGNSVFRVAHAVHALTQGEADTLAAQFGIARSSITVISNPLPPVFERRPIDPTAERPTRKRRLILFVGRVDDRKGLEHLVRAFREIEQDARFADVELRIVGDTSDPYGGELRRRIKELGLRHAHIAGAATDDQLLALYQEAAMLVLPSSYEAFGMVLIEAMSMGCPVIATRVGGIPWIVADGENGLLVEYGDRAALRDAMQRILVEPHLAERLSAAGRLTLGRFSLGYVSRRIEALYYRLLS